MSTEKKIDLERIELHARLDKWMDYVEREAPGIDNGPMQSSITFTGIVDRHINERDVEVGMVRVDVTRREEV